MSSVYVPGLGTVFIPVPLLRPCGPRMWNDGVLAVDWPQILNFPFFETPAGLAPDGSGGVFLLATGRQEWLMRTGGSYTLRNISAAGVVSAPHDFLPAIVDAGVLGPNPQAAVVPSGAGHCIVLWGWHQGLASILAQRFDTSLQGGWTHPRVVAPSPYSIGAPSNLVAEPDGSGGAFAAWWSFDANGSWAAYAAWVRKNGTLGWSGPVMVAPASMPTNPGAWLQLVPGARTGEALVVVPETTMAGTTFRAYSIASNGTVSAPTVLVGPVLDDEVSYLRTRAAVTDGKGGFFFGYADASTPTSLRVLRFRPSSGVAWDVSLGAIVDQRAFHLRGDDSGGALTAWVSAGSGTAGPRVQLLRLSQTGTISWDINAPSAFVPLELFIPSGSSAWLPDDWARLAQAVPTRGGGAMLVFEDFSVDTGVAKLFSACFDSSGIQQGAVAEVSGRTGPQELPLVAATSPDAAVTAWSDESSGFTGSRVWANKTGCCDIVTGLPYPAPIPCEINTPEGGGFGDLPFFLPCGDRDGQYGFMAMMRLARLGVNLPGCIVNRDAPAPAWMRLTFRGLPPGTSVLVCSTRRKVIGKSRRSPAGVSLTFAPPSGPQELLLAFRHRGPRTDTKPVPVRVEGSWGEGKPPAIVVRRPRMARTRGRRARTRANSRRRSKKR